MYQNAKEYLQTINTMKHRITDQEEYIQRLRDSLGIAGIRYDKDRIQSSPSNDKFTEIFSKIWDEEIVLKEMQELLVNKRVRILNEIHDLDDEKHRRILNIVYVDCKNLKKCSNIMSYSYDYTKELHIAALQAFQDKYSEKFLPTAIPLNPTDML